MKKWIWYILAVLLILPLPYLFLLSFADIWRHPDLWPDGFTIRHWKDSLLAGGLAESLLVSLFISATVALLGMTLGFGMARLIARHPKRVLLLRAAYLPYAFSSVVYAFCLQFYFLKTGLSGTIPGLILSQILIVFPFAVILFIGHWGTRMFALEELVQTLGGTVWTAWKKVVLPLSKPILLLGFFQTFLISWFDYGFSSVIGLGQVPTLTVRVFQYIGETNPYFAAVSSCLLILPPLILLWANSAYLRQRYEG
jgi:putative spermidine/putrescine transport system permease protein